MKLLLRILLTFVIGQMSPALVQGSTGFCTNRRDGLYPDPSSCTQFIHCHQNGRTAIKICPKGTRYDRAIKVCNWAGNVACTTGAPPAKIEPSAPLNLVVFPINSTAIKIKWTPPMVFSKPLRHYIVTLTRPVQPGRAIRYRINAKAKLPQVVAGLMSGTKYEVTVAAVDNVGIGTPANEAFHTPLALSPPPSNLSGSPLGPTAIMLRWKDPRLTDNNPILNYHISYKVLGPLLSPVNTQTFHGYANTAVLTNLLPGKEYQIRVQAETFGGFGAPAVVKIKTMAGGLCPPGQYSITGSKPCKLCIFGRYQAIIGQKSCLKCPTGTTTLVQGSKSILQCHKVNIG